MHHVVESILYMIRTSFKDKCFRVFLNLKKGKEILFLDLLNFLFVFGEIFITESIEWNSIKEFLLNSTVDLSSDFL